MSIVLSKVAEPYAEALLDLAKSTDSLKETTNDMNIVSQFLANSFDLKKFLGNPLITREAKKNIIKDVLGEQIGGSTLKFLLLLVDRNRIEILESIAQKFLELSYKQDVLYRAYCVGCAWQVLNLFTRGFRRSSWLLTLGCESTSAISRCLHFICCSCRLLGARS
jgi:hypothetical protein